MMSRTRETEDKRTKNVHKLLEWYSGENRIDALDVCLRPLVFILTTPKECASIACAD